MNNKYTVVSPAEHKRLERERAEKRKKAKRKKLIVLFLYFIPLLISLFSLFGYFYNSYKSEKMYEEMKTTVKTEVIEEIEVEIEKIIEEKIEEKEKIEIPIDFEKLKEENSDIYAWINVPGTNVDYPVLQSSNEDSDYWLNRAVDGTEGLPGSIYTRKINSKDFSDTNTVVYGHNMKNDTMFGSLHDFENEEFFENNKTITIYTPDNVFTYEIFAAVVHNNEDIMEKYNFDKKEDFEKFIENIMNNKDSRSNINKEANVSFGDKLITLSTCIGTEKEHRYLVVGKLV